MIKLTKHASWAQSLRHMRKRLRAWPLATHQALLQEAQLLRQIVVDGVTKQSPGDEQALKPLSLLTLASRRLKGFHGTKALLRHADLRNSINVTQRGRQVFVGVLRQAKGRDSSTLVDLAVVHEFGTPPFVIKMTPRMRRYLAILMAKAGKSRKSNYASRQPYVIVQIPARPFMRPAGRKFQCGLQKRFLQRLQALVEKHAGTP
jgi:hypothetical protein